MNTSEESLREYTRRQFLGNTAKGLGTAAIASLLAKDATAGGIPHAQLPTAKAKRAIYLFMSGGPAQMDMYDDKPKMGEWFDKDLPDSVRMGQRLTTMTSKQARFPIAPSKYSFQQYGQGGTWMSELLPYTQKVADELAVIRTVWTEAINHDPAITYIQTGRQIPGLPSLGSWLSYGLGSANENLPTFVVLTATWSGRKQAQALYQRLWSSGPLASRHAGVSLRSSGDPVLYLSNPSGVDSQVRRAMLDGVNAFNQRTYEKELDPVVQDRISQYEMAFRMQSSVPDLTDLSKEPDHVFERYGPDSRKPGTFAYSCLLARRLAERGVRLTQIFHRGWDQHGGLPKDLPNQCRDIDQPTYALLTDLKERGLLDDTLVVWGGEFGRTVYCQGKLTKDNYGRDHHPKCFTMWMAGGGVKGGVNYGVTDDFSYNIVENPVHIRDINATIMHQLGIDHEKLSIKFKGLDLRLTGVEPTSPVKAILS